MILFLYWARRLWPLALALVVVGVVTGYGLHWLHRHDAAIRIEQQLQARDTIIATRTDTAAARTTERRVDSVTVYRQLIEIRSDTVWRRDTVRLAGDTTPRIAIPVGVLIQHDSAFAACDRLSRDCSREHAADSLVIVELRQSLALARTGNAIPPPARSWSFSVTAGWGGTAVRDSTRGWRVMTGPSLVAGGSFRVF
jgi:hypothetical protein